ncbi:butyrate kinase [bacterium]|nr:butyrate kinase [bacterium]
MFDIGASLDRELQEGRTNRPVVLFIEPEDPRVIEAATRVPRFARPVFLATEEQVEAVIAEHLGHVDPARLEFMLSEAAFCELAGCPELQEELAQAVLTMPAERRPVEGLEAAREFTATPAGFGIMAVHEGHADMVVGGAQHEPRDFFRPMIKVMQKEPVVCEAGIIILPDSHPEGIYPHNILVIGDVGVNATVDPETLARSAVGTCAVARDLIPMDELREIRGVIVSYSNRGGDEGPSPRLVREATQLLPRFMAERCEKGARYCSIDIEGEVKINVALSQRSAQLYRKGGEGNGEYKGTNVLITPNLDTGNLLFHLFATRYPDAHKFGAVFGIRFRGVDLPMDVEPEDAALAVKAAVLRLQKFGEWQRTPRDTFFPRPRILAINPGSTSTKLAIFEGEEEIFGEELKHPAEELEPFEGQRISAQFEFRKDAIEDFLAKHDLSVEQLDAVSARGGLVKPIPHGTYAVNQRMREDLMSETGADHASNLGALIAHALVGDRDKPAYIVDPVVVDEMDDRNRVTGLKEIRRKAISHALNQIATAHRYARDAETFYERLNVIVCHMGGGISIGAHRQGRFIDVNNALDGEGPFSPQRSGSLPVGDLIRLCFSGKYTMEELLKLNKGRGGLIDLLGTTDFMLVEKKYLAGDPDFAPVFEAMCYQISKWICSMVPAFDGEPVDRVLLTGGLARARPLVALVEKACEPLGCGVSVYPGENEMVALAQGALRVLSGREDVREYAPE